MDGSGRKRKRGFRAGGQGNSSAKSNCSHRCTVVCSRAPHIPNDISIRRLPCTVVLEGGIDRVVPTNYLGKIALIGKAKGLHLYAEVQAKTKSNRSNARMLANSMIMQISPRKIGSDRGLTRVKAFACADRIPA